MKQYYESEVLYQLMERDGFNIPSSVPPYEAEIKAYLINQVKQAYPKLTDYEAEWLLYNYTKHLPADFPISSVSDVTTATFENVVPYAYQSAILKGSTKYRDIDTGEILEAFEEGRNLELVSVKMPVLTTSNEDGTKTNILTVNEDVELRGIGEVRDELDLLTGEYIQNIGEVVLNGRGNWHEYNTNSVNTYCAFNTGLIADYKGTVYLNNKLNKLDDSDIDNEGIRINSSKRIFVRLNRDKGITDLASFKQYLSQNPITVQYQLATKSIKTVELTTVNENEESVYFMPLEGTMHVQSTGENIPPTFDMSVPVEATTQNLASFIDMKMEE